MILIASYCLLGSAVGIDLAIGFYSLLVPVISVLLRIPSLGGLGVREGATEFLFSRAGVAERQALALAVAHDATLIVTDLIGGDPYCARADRGAPKVNARMYFVRHGESEANVLGVISNRGAVHGLTERGRRQVKALARELQGAGVAQVYSSPLLRARETADILATALDVACKETDALREFDCGIAEGRSDPGAWALHQTVVEAWMEYGDLDARIEEGESFVDVRDRFVPFVRGLMESYEEAAPVILVGHGGLYQCMLPLVLENLDQGAELPLPNAGYVLAEVRAGKLLCLEGCGKRMVGSA